MKRILSVILCVLVVMIAIVGLSGCGCADKNVDSSVSAVQQSEEPSKDIVGEWGGRSDDVSVKFNDDGSCEIGGIQGTYEIDDKNTLTVTPKSENENDTPQPMVFEYYSGDTTESAVPSNQWAIQDGTIYINGYQYTRQTAEENQSENTQGKSDNTKTESKTDTSKTESKSDNSKTESKSDTSKAESKSDTSKTESKSDTSKTESTTSSSQTISETSAVSPSEENSRPTTSHKDGEEDEVVVIYQNLDDFVDMD
ncbi:MAG: hypothetical protein IJU14_02850 [Clostridia bacterium]|nr:hypothetical protein [Clostridia bacterium]